MRASFSSVCSWTAALSLLLAGGVLPAQKSVYLRGYEVTPNHTVFGKIDSLQGENGVINLGYAHGIRPGLSLVVVRRVQESLIPVAGMTVLATEGDHSRVRLEGPFRAEVNDFVLIHASKLDLWKPETRLDQLARTRLSRRLSGKGYNTIDVSPELIEEVARDDDFVNRQHVEHEKPTFIAKAESRTHILKGFLGATTPLPPADPNRPEIRQTEIDKTDPTVLLLRQYLEVATDREAMISRLNDARLRVLIPTESSNAYHEDRTSLTRQSLMAWTTRALTRS